MKISINTYVENGTIKNNLRAIKKALKQFEGKHITLTIERKKKIRSTMQNAYYWGVIIPIIQNGFKDSWNELHSSKEVHEFLKRELNYTEFVNKVTGEIIKVGKSTTESSTIQYEEYLEACRQFCNEWFEIVIPLPNEQSTFELD